MREAGEMLRKRAIKIERESRANERANGQEGRGGGGERERDSSESETIARAQFK